jgi:hypothetical protein
MQLTVEPKYEEQFTAFIDFLGFREVALETDDSTRLKVLNLLKSLSELRGEFNVQSTGPENFKTRHIRPAISTFSDHIVISYPTKPISADTGFDERNTAFFIRMHFSQLLKSIAAAALRIGFLVRGGATIDKLHHVKGVVFGKALVDAYEIESQTSIYPRVVLSHHIARQQMWTENQADIVKCSDGLYQFNYFKSLALSSAERGEGYAANVKAWFEEVIGIVDRNLREFESKGKLKELAKWAWFAREFRIGLENNNLPILESLGVSMDAIPWPK